MKIRSIEPTPSPNAMKLNLDERLPEGKNFQFTKKQKDHAPAYLRELLSIEGVTSVFQVLDFISLERHPKANWETILSKARTILGEIGHTDQNVDPTTTKPATNDQDFLEVAVYIQKIRGIPMQIKLVKGDEEVRVGLPERFKKAVMKVQPSVDNLIFERKWVEQSPRYGELDLIGSQVAEEIRAAYDQERLNRLVEQALSNQTDPSTNEALSPDQLEQALRHPDWKKRYQALERMAPSLEMLPHIERALQDEKQSIRRLAVVTLGFIEKKAVLPLLIRALKDRSPIVRRTAGDTLSDLGYKEAIPAMCEALMDDNKLVRWRAARFLFEVGDESAISALRKASSDPEFEVRLQAKIALERIEKGEEASGTVWQQMTKRMKEDD